MLEWLDSIFSNIEQKLVDYGLETVMGVKNLKLTLETLERSLKSLRAKASDVEEQIKKAQLSGKKKRKREVENWLDEVQIVEGEFLAFVNGDGFIKQFFNGDLSGKLCERVDGLLQQSQNFGDELVLDGNVTRGDPLLASKLIGKSFDENLEKIWKFLVVDKVPSNGIYGMGGVGKTSLAKHIHNRLLKETQYNVYWVTVSQAFSIKGLQDGIAQAMGLDLLDEDNEDKRAAILNRALSSKKDLVLILDDVWNNICLEKVGDPLHVEDCRLIITSRSSEVCHRIGCRELILVETLDTNDAWNLFRKTLGSETELDPQIEKIAKGMAKKCDGLPLGIITLAGSMRGVTNIHVWKNALIELEESLMEQDEMEEEVFGVLKFSFDRLVSNYQREERKNGYTKVQLCFLYCSLYPEDFKIDKNELICKFISEKLMDKRKTREAEYDQGHAILDKLVNVCLLEVDQSRVRMHDLVRSMALKIARGNPTFMVLAGLSLKEIPNEEEWTEDLEKVSLMRNQISELPLGISPNCPKLSTLLLNHNSLVCIPESFFLQMSGLQVLDLSETRIKELPYSLSNLERLNALLVRNCQHLAFVPCLGKLKALKELCLSHSPEIDQVPQGMENLVNLRFLDMVGLTKLEMLPIGLLCKYPLLQHLALPHQIQPPLLEIEQLKQLEYFYGRFEAVGDFNLFIKSRESRRCPSRYIVFLGKTPHSYYWSRDFYEHNINNSRRVHIVGCSIRKEEEEDDTILFPEDIQQLVFNKCEGLSNSLLDDLARLNIPRSLMHLEIEECEGIECISNEPADSSHPLLRTLERICLTSLPNFTGIGINGFPSLKRLIITECNKIKKLGLRGADLQKFEYIGIFNCEEIEEIIQVEDERMEGDVSLPNLQRLDLLGLPKLNCICKAKLVCSSIEEISFDRCQSLKKLPLYLPSPEYGCRSPAPVKIEIHEEEEKEWWESVEWEHPIHRELVVHYLSSQHRR